MLLVVSKKHLPRYLNEIGFRWDHRLPKEKVTKNGKPKTIMVPLPVMDMLRSLVINAIGKQLRWSIKGGLLQVQLSADHSQ